MNSQELCRGLRNDEEQLVLKHLTWWAHGLATGNLELAAEVHLPRSVGHLFYSPRRTLLLVSRCWVVILLREHHVHLTPSLIQDKNNTTIHPGRLTRRSVLVDSSFHVYSHLARATTRPSAVLLLLHSTMRRKCVL